MADEDGNFDPSVPDDETPTFVNDLERPVGSGDQGRAGRRAVATGLDGLD
ncbi:MAG: hypothetical protein H7270_09140 [Dermatophilaceae bacterium]|nr:hypothetical protein [Dermatophilaceae bacterium]